jgi:arylsulfatase A-like enzyme
VYAGALSHADYNIGCFLDALEESGQRDDTLVMYLMGDNGVSAERSLQARATRSAHPETELRRASVPAVDDRRAPAAPAPTIT